jgi:hypothetical protein
MKLICIIFFGFCCLYTNAQTAPNFDLIKLEKASDYKAAVPFVLQTANYLLTTPYRSDNADRTNSVQFLGKWMNGTTDYAFVFGDVVDKIGKGNNDLIGLYMAAMTKYTIENKAAAKDPKVVEINSFILLLNYCENKDNNMKMSKQLKKLSDAKQKGQLEEALK